MGLRQRQWAARTVERLKGELGGQCQECGDTDLSTLEFDHLQPRDWEPRKVEWSARISRYRREIAEGKIQLLCKSCNSRKGHPVITVADSDDDWLEAA